jgi:hypothetical protein
MTYPMPGGAFPGRQWEAHVRRMVRDGCGREEIIYTMTSANWPYDDAMTLVRRIGSGERWKGVWMMIGGAALAIVTGLVSVLSLALPEGGVILYGPCFFGIGLFIYGLVRLAKMKV